MEWGNVSERFQRVDITLDRFEVKPAIPKKGYYSPYYKPIKPEEVYKQTKSEAKRSGTVVGIKNEDHIFSVTVFHPTLLGGRGISIRPGTTANISATGKDVLNGWEATCEKQRKYLKLEIQYFWH